MPSNRAVTYKSQKGAAILMFALIVIAGVSYFFIHQLNSSTNRHERALVSNEALNIAKDALIGWSIHHPDNPGMLLFPDRNGDAGGYDGLSDCTSGVVNNNLLLGRLPFLGQGTPCRSPLTGLKIDAKDFLGEDLWYAVSKNLVYESPDYPFVSPALLNKATDWITVRDANGNVLSDRVAFVLIAPNVALEGQDRSGSAPDAVHYLDNITIGATNYSNANYDQDFIIYPDSEYTDITTDSFNDQLIFVTIDEFMAKLEQRAINELSHILSTYHTDEDGGDGAFPWLSPFADPKVELNNLSGFADTGSSSTLLIDSSKDFMSLGVSQNDIIYNITDGSIGEISAGPTLADRVSVNMLLFEVGDSFDDGDEYHILRKQLQTTLSGTATAGSSGLTLEDSTKNFTVLDIELGDVVDNIDDGSSGIISLITTDEITVESLTGGTENDFDNSEAYLIRSNFGVNSSNSDTTLQDNDKDFVTLGVQSGDLLWNMTDESIARVTNVAATTLTIDRLYYGADNDFDAVVGVDEDSYMLPRFNKVDNTRLGQLAFHNVGEPFPTQLDLSWTITNAAATDISFDTSIHPDTDPDYQDSLEFFLKPYVEAGGNESFNNDNAACFWSVPEIVDCYALLSDIEYLSVEGDLTSDSEPNGARFLITDTNASFTNEGVKRGDIAINYDDETSIGSGTSTAGTSGLTLVDSVADFSALLPYQFMIQNDDQAGRVQGIISKIIDANTIEIENYDGEGTTDINFTAGDDYTIYQPNTFMVSAVNSDNQVNTDYLVSATNADFDTGEQYRIITASKSFSASPDSPLVCFQGSNCTFTDTSKSESYIDMGIEVGDVIELETEGELSGVPLTRNGQGKITNVTDNQIQAVLYGSLGSLSVASNSTYTVYYDYVDSRQFEIHARFRGDLQTTTVNQERHRNVCLNYDSTCTTASPAAFTQLNGGQPFIIARDYQDDGVTEVGRASFSPTAASTGSVMASNIDYYLSVQSGDLPEWFIRNKWYQYFYIAYSSGGDIPGDATPCIAGTDCLTLNIDTPTVTTQDNIRAIIVYSGRELANQAASQASGLINAYFENENANGDDIFDKMEHEYNAGSEPINYNDRIRIGISCPSPLTSEICWQ